MSQWRWRSEPYGGWKDSSGQPVKWTAHALAWFLAVVYAVLFVLAVGVVLSLSGCGVSPPTAPPAPQFTERIQQPAPRPQPVAPDAAPTAMRRP